MAIEEKKLLIFTKANKKNLNQTLEMKISDLVKNKVNVQNVAAYFRLANVFHLSKLAEFTMRYIERCFPIVAETTGFLQLDHPNVSKILASAEVRVSSEIEVFSAADSWMSYDLQGRSQFAENILLKVRLPLLSLDALKSILCSSSSFHKIETCKALVDEILRNKEGFYENKSSIYHFGRYCSQKSFNITFLEYKVAKSRHTTEKRIEIINTKQVDGNDFESTKDFTQIPDNSKSYLKRFLEEAVYSNGAIYHIGNFSNDPGEYFWLQTPIFIQKYSLLTKTFSEPFEADFDDFRRGYCVCAFMKKIYVIGGLYDEDDDDIDEYSTSEFDVKTQKWKKVGCINELRRNAAAAVFQGQIVVSGGWQYDEDERSNTVEVYDHAADKWSYMPNMIFGRSFHSLVAVRSKLFAIGSYNERTCEVYDGFTKTFALIKTLPPTNIEFNLDFSRPISIGSKVQIFERRSARVATYDVDEEKWSVEPFTTTTTGYDACLKIPKL